MSVYHHEAMSLLGAPAATVWAHATSVEGINGEVELDPRRRFVERSPVRSQKLWQHEREVVPAGNGCRLTDRLTFEPRFGGPVVAALLRRIFAGRHAELRRRFGAQASP